MSSRETISFSTLWIFIVMFLFFLLLLLLLLGTFSKYDGTTQKGTDQFRIEWIFFESVFKTKFHYVCVCVRVCVCREEDSVGCQNDGRMQFVLHWIKNKGSSLAALTLSLLVTPLTQLESSTSLKILESNKKEKKTKERERKESI